MPSVAIFRFGSIGPRTGPPYFVLFLGPSLGVLYIKGCGVARRGSQPYKKVRRAGTSIFELQNFRLFLLQEFV